jgi:hypothetical protein
VRIGKRLQERDHVGALARIDTQRLQDLLAVGSASSAP